jgi:amidase
MKVPRPQAEQVAALAAGFGITLSDDEARAIAAHLAESAAALEQLDSFRHLVPRRPVAGLRRSEPPKAADNPLGAWACRSEIRARDDGALAGRSIAIKDSITVAGVPMTAGSALLDGFVPDCDATVVQRVLDAGATITGKAVCDALCLSAGGHTADSGPVRNPYDRERLSGGSSGGCAALVASGAVDLAIGGDNGGSIRIPSSWCGVYGLKPTWGLVPYTGAASINPLIDHLGPMARTPEDLERLLRVIAGPDESDPRQRAGLRLASAPNRSAPRIGILREGFGWRGRSDPAVDALVEESARALARYGCRVSEVSVALHRESMKMMAGLQAETERMLFAQNAVGGPFLGDYDEALIGALGRWRERPQALPLAAKLMLLGSAYLRDHVDGTQYALSLNLVNVLAAAYDRALEACDMLVLPTTVTTARRIPAPDAGAEERLRLGWQGLNTRMFNATGHPAMNVPCGLLEGLPVGLCMVGRRGEDLELIAAARLFAERVYAPNLPAPT